MFIIGELINGMYKNVGEAIVKKDKKTIHDLAIAQSKAGADALDLNCGPVSKDQVTDMKWLIETVQEVTKKTLTIDSSKPKVIQETIQLVKNRPMINSTTADTEKLEILVPLAKQNNCGLIALAMDKKGITKWLAQEYLLVQHFTIFST